MRCQYCHNPDTWSLTENKKYSVQDILEEFDGVKEFVVAVALIVLRDEDFLLTESGFAEFGEVTIELVNCECLISHMNLVFDYSTNIRFFCDLPPGMALCGFPCG
jgi:hypothetical protein